MRADGRKKLLVSCLLFVLVSVLSGPSRLGALEISATEWELGLRWIGNWEDELSGSSGNVLTTTFSFRLPVALSEDSDFSLVPGLSLYTLRYRWDEDAERTVLSDIEWRELTAVVPLLDTLFRWDFYEGPSTRLALDGGLGFELPVPVRSWDNAGRTSDILSGYYGKSKYVLPTFALYGYWPLANAFDVSTRLGTYLPIHHLWDGEDAPFYDHLMVAFTLGIRLPTGTRSVEDASEPPTPEGAPPLPEESAGE